ncbi:hypothetical protein [Gordonia sp. OPL2]|uniref:hypothetical protein n=1 Tax=Gordonia sp. OPL2 TaxID=2486274 RepID=UPI0016559A39|nr:hypothetical protein [Gordonia sp. OPL2]
MVERLVRVALVVIGVGAVAYGVSLMWGFSTADQISIVIWLAVGLFLHDAVLAPVALAVSWVLRRWLPPWWSRSVLIALALTNVVVLLALPVILPRPADDGAANSSVLDRDYWLGLTIVIVVIWAIALGATILLRRLNPSAPTPPPR